MEDIKIVNFKEISKKNKIEIEYGSEILKEIECYDIPELMTKSLIVETLKAILNMLRIRLSF